MGLSLYLIHIKVYFSQMFWNFYFFCFLDDGLRRTFRWIFIFIAVEYHKTNSFCEHYMKWTYLCRKGEKYSLFHEF